MKAWTLLVELVLLCAARHCPVRNDLDWAEHRAIPGGREGVAFQAASRASACS